MTDKPVSYFSPTPHEPSHDRIHSLDGLCAVAISILVASHITKIDGIPGGFGVMLFLVISGSLITTVF